MPETNSRDNRQRRCLPVDFQTREADGELYIEGYFAVFNSEYEFWPGATEIILPGAFDESVSGDVRALVNHNADLVLGRTKSGTLELKQDSRGLWGRICINQEDRSAMDLYARVKRGDVSQCSFGFVIESERFVDLGGGKCRWEVEKINPLYEVSPCTFPAYEETGVSARKADYEAIRHRRLETWRMQAKAKLTGGKNSGT
mgnify:FL=1